MIEKQYRNYYIYGYLNYINVSCSFFKTSYKHSYVNKKVKKTFSYLGIPAPKKDFSRWKWLISLLETFVSVIMVFGRCVIVLFQRLLASKHQIKRLRLFAPQTWDSFRIKDMLRSLEGQEVSTMHIPFVNNSYKQNEIKIIWGISFRDIWDSFISSLCMVFYMPYRFGKGDILFRSYASFEYFLTCRFVKRMEKNNSFVYINTFDRWAFLFCSSETEVTFLQHGKLEKLESMIRVGTPSIAYYISPEQKAILEDTLFTTPPMRFFYRKMLQFSSNEVLNHKNGKRNVLVVSAVPVYPSVEKVIGLVSEFVNVYVKPHPSEKAMDFYDKLISTYGVTLLEKTAYPEVDLVLSYNSTLADEYDLAGVRVIRWDLLKDIDEIKELVTKDMN